MQIEIICTTYMRESEEDSERERERERVREREWGREGDDRMREWMRWPETLNGSNN